MKVIRFDNKLCGWDTEIMYIFIYKAAYLQKQVSLGNHHNTIKSVLLSIMILNRSSYRSQATVLACESIGWGPILHQIGGNKKVNTIESKIVTTVF